MRLLTPDALACSRALGEVHRKADAIAQAHDTQEAMSLLRDLSLQVTRTMVLIREAEERARSAGLEESEKRFQAQIHYLTEHRA